MSTETANYGLKTWDERDYIRVSEINGNFTQLDTLLKSMLNMKTGSYVGTGTYGYDNRNTIFFEEMPHMVLIYGPDGGQMIVPNRETHLSTEQYWFRREVTDAGRNVVTWGENSMTWYCDYAGNYSGGYHNSTYPVYQLNNTGKTYIYMYF